MPKVLVTGAAGFIGFHLTGKLVALGYEVVGIDNLNSYYDVALKENRLRELEKLKGFTFFKADLKDRLELDKIFDDFKFDYVINLAAQAGVRYSIENPYAYLESNMLGFLNILELCRHYEIKHLVYASSSSVYGANTQMPFSVSHNVDHPISFYATSKKSNELMAHTYSALFQLPTTGLRFFTVYGPYGRPDMALFLFTNAILNGKSIDVFNHGQMKRDFTYIDDIVEGISRLLPTVPTKNISWDSRNPDPATSFAPYRIYNIGNNQPVALLKFIEVLEEKLGRKAMKNFLPMQDGDVPETFADISALVEAVGFKPQTSIEEGIGKFVDWYKNYYKVS
jgi:UDP-glucuronate 4-epimerase